MQITLITLAMLVVTAVAALLHSGSMNDVIAWDEANYTIAAKQGIVANAFQMGELGKLRHQHGPVMCYAIAASTYIFGNDEWAIRLPAVLACALSCGLLVLIGLDLSRGAAWRLRLMVGISAGIILATSPASIELAGVIQPHSFVVLFMVINFWTLGRYLRDLRQLDAILFGLSMAAQFATTEYAPVILCYAILATMIARPSLIFGEGAMPMRSLGAVWRSIVQLRHTVHRDIKRAALACLIGTAVLWPAGLFLLGIPYNFLFFLAYAAQGHPVLFQGELTLHVPKYAYTYWYWIEYPMLLIGMITAMLLIIIWAWRDRTPVARMMAVFMVGLTASVHGAHIMQLCKSIFMIPPIALGSPLAAAAFWRSVHETRTSTRQNESQNLMPRLTALACMTLLVITVLGARITPMSRSADPNQKLITMATTIAAQAAPGDRILAQGWPMVKYLLHLKLGRTDLHIAQYDPRNYESDHLGKRMQGHEFAWAITIGPVTAANPDCLVLHELRTHWHIANDLSLPDREYRLYQSPAAVTASAPMSASAAPQR